MKFKLIILVLVLAIMIVINPDYAFAADPIFITISDSMENVKFDGKWSSQIEWKESSLNTLRYNDSTTIQLRSAHQGNFLYFLIDVVSDVHLDKGSDKVMICLDTDNDKTLIANSNDFCFIISLGSKKPLVLRGDSPLGFNGHFDKITNPDGFIGISNVSDENDRYSKIPHGVYEFRIPTDAVGRKDVYGYYMSVYDAHNNTVYSWPQEIKENSQFKIPSPSLWGEIVSPDKSLPESPIPIFLLVFSVFLTVVFTKLKIIILHL